MNTYNNPYDDLRPVTDADGFYGREAEIEVIARSLAQARYCSVAGDRRIGKTSLLFSLMNSETLQNPRTMFVYMDLELRPSSDARLFKYLYKRMHDSVTRKFPETTFTFPSVDAVRAMEYADEVIVYGISELLDELFDRRALDAVYLLIDEGEFLATVDAGNQLRHLLNEFTGRLGCILTSVALLVDMTEEGNLSPLYNVFDSIILGQISRDAAIRLIESKKSPPPVPFDDSEVEAILSLAGHHPALLKVVCSTILKGKVKANIDHYKTSNGSFVDELLLSEIDNAAEPICKSIVEGYRTSVIDIQGVLASGSGLYTEEIDTLLARGVLTETEAGVKVASELLRDYVLRNLSEGYSGEHSEGIPLASGRSEPLSLLVSPSGLSTQEDTLYRLLVSEPGRVFGKEEIALALSEADEVKVSYVPVLVQRLRDRLHAIGLDEVEILNVRSQGYRIVRVR